jgi:hypothetical protein
MDWQTRHTGEGREWPQSPDVTNARTLTRITRLFAAWRSRSPPNPEGAEFGIDFPISNEFCDLLRREAMAYIGTVNL